MAEPKHGAGFAAFPKAERKPHLGKGGLRPVPFLGPVFLLVAALTTTIPWPPAPLLVWNRSASSPVGLYRIDPPSELESGDHVLAWAPGWARQLGSERRYLPANVPLVKRIAAAAGDRICADGATISLNGAAAAVRHRSDGLGRPMPWWNGCRTLGTGEYFLFDPVQSHAFDGRYFGITPQARIVGRARLIWRA